MPKPDIPEGYKNHPTYPIPEAVLIWAAALYDVPLPMDPGEGQKYSQALAMAERELRDHVPIQSVEYWESPNLAYAASSRSAIDWTGYPGGPPYPTRTMAPDKVRRTRECFRGPDLAGYAWARGYPGLFGFEEPDSPATNATNSLREDTKEGYLFLIGLMAHTIAEMSGPDMKNPKGDPNLAALLEKLKKTARTLKVSIEKGDGFTKTPFNNKVSAALEEVRNRQRGWPLSP